VTVILHVDLKLVEAAAGITIVPETVVAVSAACALTSMSNVVGPVSAA